MKRKAILIFGVCFLLMEPTGPAALPSTAAKEIHHDPFGVWQKKPHDFDLAVRAGAKVVFMPEERTFFTYWVPPHYRSGRVVVSVHGTGGNPYIAIRDEFKTAEAFDYLAVAVSWYSEDRGFYSAQDLYRNILQALNYIQSKSGNDLSKVAYIGFSRGAAVSYEVAYLDRQSANIFDLIIAHSGGIPRDLKIEAKNPSAQADHFFYQLSHDELGKEVFSGKSFFLYSGDQDQSWGGTGMSLQMAYAKELIEGHGGRVVEWVRAPHLGHTGFLQSPEIKAKALRYFVDLSRSR